MMFDYNARTEMVREGVDPDTGIDFDARYQSTYRPGIAFFLWGYDLRWTEETCELICPSPDVCAWTELPEYERTPDGHDPNICYAYGEPELYEYKDVVRVTMVGDDQIDTMDISELQVIDPLSYCSECGQVGCYSDGRDRSEWDGQDATDEHD